MNKLMVMKDYILYDPDLKCPVCGTEDDLEEFTVYFCRCKTCRSNLVLVESEKDKEAEG